ncbi:MAG: sigma-70 family RNA polymerase sigma factor [Myxococcota bacterium]
MSRPVPTAKRDEWQADLRLAQAVDRGDREAASELVRRLLPRTRNLVRYLVRGDRDVEDFAQSSLLEVLRSVGSFRGQSSLEHWAARITVRKTRAALAKRAKGEARANEPALRVIRPASVSTPYELRRDLARALDALPAPQREAMVLFHVVGMTLREVAAETSVSPDTAKSRIRLALEKLRHALGERHES